MELFVDDFGEMEADVLDRSVKRFTWKTSGMEVQVISYGATITSIRIPDAKGKWSDIVMGFDNMKGYQNAKNPYFGATVGRYANRIKNSRFTLDGETYKLTQNKDGNQLHGGFKGFDKVNWNSYIDGDKVVFSYLSKDGEEGFPGNVLTNITYEVECTTLKMHIVSRCTKPTPINLTNHSYFNLAGHSSGAEELYKHEFILNTSTYTPLDSAMTTTGAINTLDQLGIKTDLKNFTPLLDFMPKGGLDTNFCIEKEQGTNLMAKVFHRDSGRLMELYSNQPGVQFYTSNFLPDKDAKEEDCLRGKNGTVYNKHGAFCLEPQAYPNALNHKNFPNTILYPGKEYVHDIVLKFQVN